MGLNTGLYDLMACKASALSTGEKEHKGGCLGRVSELPGVWEEKGERLGGRLPTQMRPRERTSRQTTADALRGLGQGKHEQDGVGRPSA